VKVEKKFNPFENPSPDLLVAEVPEGNASHNLVLNKFPVIEDHFILATKAYKRQTDLLEEDDISLTYACLKAWEDAATDRKLRMYAFFNSGEHSGASQPHRHIQFLPVEKMAVGLSEQSWDVLTDTVASSPQSTTSGKWTPETPGTFFYEPRG
jgi:sulfate adenylyltransferase (ADP) / ATP adenylyltransferase